MIDSIKIRLFEFVDNVLVRTKNEKSLLDFSEEVVEENLIIIDSYDLIISKWLNENKDQSKTFTFKFGD